MKKITNLVLVLMLLTSITTYALAAEADDPPQDDPDIENETNDEVNESSEESSFESETQDEIEIMKDPLGARIRLLQLEKAILINILKGNMVIQVLKELEVNTTELEDILADLQDVLEEVQEADPTAENSVQVFVQLKNESRILTKQFRDTLRLLLDEDTINMIKERLRKMDSDEILDFNMRIRQWVRQFNRNQLYRLFGLVGEEDTSLLDEYLNGDIDLEQVKLHLYKLMNQMTKQKRYMIFSEIKEENIKNRIQAHEAMQNMGYNGRGKGHGGRP
jgi:hypothetical protein